MRTAAMITYGITQENLGIKTEEFRTVKSRLKARVTVVVRFILAEENEKPYGLDLSPAMKARLAL